MVSSTDFRQVYCTQNAISESEYAEHLLVRALPAHARIYRAISQFTFQNKNHFRADFDFINNVGCLRNYRDYSQSVDEFVVHPWNKRSLLRGWLRLRVSTSRVREIVREKFKSERAQQPVLNVSSAADSGIATPPANGLHTESTLSNEQKGQIKERLEQISASHTPATPQLERLPGKTDLGPNKSSALHCVNRHQQTRHSTTNQGQTQTAAETEINVLRVVNERLKGELTRVTAQRDILKQAAAILASP